ncbi:hypothetical protein CK507_16430 [Pseudomonas sp. WN033]|nr:hypothetical protein CK507_16430 [Pseudomonas sp. WN033]
MCQLNSFHQHSKVFYKPIEAAIRWSDLTRFEHEIIEALGTKNRPSSHDFPRWPILYLNTELIFDALFNGDLPYGRRGITCADSQLLSDPALTIRHVDLRSWMSQYYPDQRPAFLFDDFERQLHPAINIDVVQVLLAEREAWRARCATCSLDFEELESKHLALRKEHDSLTARLQPDAIGRRAETTYLHIIGALLHLMLGESPSGRRYSTFMSQDAIISALIAHHSGLMGITERTLHAKFAEAKRRMPPPPA